MPGGPGGGGFMPGDLSGVLPGGLAYGGYGGPDDYAPGAGRGVYGLRDDGGGAGEASLGGGPSQLGAGALAGAAGLLPMMDPQGRVFYYEPQANAF